MRVSEVITRLDDNEKVKIRNKDLVLSGTKQELLHDESFYSHKVGDMIVTHLGICDTILGVGLFIKGERL